jgi:hypothetical protein
MPELHALDNSQLMDLLAKYTSDYTKMLADGSLNDEYEKCKLTIKAIHTEIDSRKNIVSNASGETNMTTPPDFS